MFKDYRLRIAEVTRDYWLTERDQAPADSRQAHGRGRRPIYAAPKAIQIASASPPP